jgi:hypothetical protein
MFCAETNIGACEHGEKPEEVKGGQSTFSTLRFQVTGYSA